MSSGANLKLATMRLLAASWVVPALTAPKALSQVIAVLVTVTLIILLAVVPILRRLREVREKLAARTDRASVEDRLDELERLKRRDLVTDEEYAAKRQEILKDL